MSSHESDCERYRRFVRQLEARPPEVSPLMFVATMSDAPPEASAWLLRWAAAQR